MTKDKDQTRDEYIRELEELAESRQEALLTLGEMSDSSEKELLDFGLEQGIRATKSVVGFLGFISEDEEIMTIHSFSRNTMKECSITNKPITFSIDKSGIWGESIRNRKPVIINDYDAPHPSKKGYPDGHMEIKSFLGLPIFSGKRIVMAAAVANKKQKYTESDVRELTLILQSIWRIIERKRTREELRESEEKFKTLFESSADGILMADAKTKKIAYANKAICELLGYTEEELTNMEIMDIHPKEDLAYVLSEFECQAKGEKTLAENIPCLKKDGTVIFAEINATPFTISGKGYQAGFFRDITDRKQAEEKYSTIIKTALDGFWITDTKGKFLEVNDSYCSMSGYSRKELMRMSISDLEVIETPEEIEERMKFFAKQGYLRFETRHRRKDGLTFDVEVNATYSDVDGGRAIVFLRDITKRQQADEVIKRLNEKLEHTVAEQSLSILELSTPAIPLLEEIVVLPLVGVIDSVRAQQIIENLLQAIVQNIAKVAIIDVTGVPVIDTKVAQHLLKTVTAAKMLGAEVIITGIRPDTAQTLTKLQINLAGLRTRGTLRAGIVDALRLTGRRVTSEKKSHNPTSLSLSGGEGLDSR